MQFTNTTVFCLVAAQLKNMHSTPKSSVNDMDELEQVQRRAQKLSEGSSTSLIRKG